jgi:hypothetical protein
MEVRIILNLFKSNTNNVVLKMYEIADELRGKSAVTLARFFMRPIILECGTHSTIVPI